MLIDSEIFTEINPIEGMSDLDYVQARVALDAAPAMTELLDASSLNTVLAMLEVIDSAEDLALLETLTPAQKRQVWEATPELIRDRLKQLRTKSEPSASSPRLAESEPVESEPVESESAMQSLSDADNLLLEETLSDLETGLDLELNSDESDQPETAPETAIDLDLTNSLTDSVNLVPQISLAVGDWIVLQAKPQLTAAELIAIWEVLEVRDGYARIVASQLGTRTYPIAWMLLYSKPIGYQEPEF